MVGYNKYNEKFDKHFKTDNLKIDKNSKVIIKDFADSVLRIYQMGKYFAVEKKRKWNPENLELGDFYSNPKFGYEKFYDNAYVDIVQAYNLLRNYLTRKPYNEKKWKLNFKNPTLADGWDKNKEIDNFAIILRKNGKYFLGLMKKGCNHLFVDKNRGEFRGTGYQKMIYKLLPGANKMLPKVFFSKLNIDFFNPSTEILKIRNHSSHTKGGNPQKGFKKKKFNIKDCYALIDFFKKSLNIHKEWKDFNFTFSNTFAYKDISDFYRDVEKGGYKISFQDIPESYIEEKNKNGELYLFQIKNKDWNEGSTGTKNLHTLYFENLFSPENIAKNFPFKLNGRAEIFYRPKTEKLKKEKIKTKKNKIILDKGEKAFQKNRYTENKIFFHIPITLNRGKGKASYFNQELNNFLVDNSGINIIGVDRGEKHLAYYSVISQNQEILDSGTLNEIGNVDYHQKLEDRAKNRKQARKDWQDVRGIKDLKKGYISQVVRRLADLAIKYNAIIVFEDLNMRFKQIRGGIEKSVYQQLEKALIEKLNFLVDKGEKDSEKAGNLLKARQLTAPFTTFKEMGKQTGILFYTQANYTSITDPVTGFRKNIYVNNSASIEKIKSEIKKFDEIGWDENLKSYYFKYDAKAFNKNGEGESKKWIIYANVPRIRREKINGYWNYKVVNPNKMLKALFKVYDFGLSSDINQQIKDKESRNELGEKEFDGKSRNFYKSLIFIINLILQVRNSFSEKSENEKTNYIDFIASPAYPLFATEAIDKKGRKLLTANFDDFEKKFLSNTKNKEKIKKEFNGDANGAFNIARKGIIILNKINEWYEENEKLKKANKTEKFYPDLYISYLDWDKFVQK